MAEQKGSPMPGDQPGRGVNIRPAAIHTPGLTANIALKILMQ